MRVERDLLGERQIPESVYYGIQTSRALENFPVTGLRIDPELIHTIGLLKAACARANMELGSLSKPIGEAVVQAAEEVAKGLLDAEFPLDPIQGGAGTSINMNANEVIANRALELLGYPRGRYDVIHPATHVNMSQSTNDVIPTAVRLTLCKLLRAAAAEVEELSAAFARKAEEVADVLKAGRTHLQDALPISMGREFTAYARALARDAERLRAAAVQLEEINLGGTAIGTGLNASAAYRQRVVELLREATGLNVRSADDLVDATQNQDQLLAASQAMRGTAVTLTKICNDLRLMASGPRAGLGEITLPAVQPGSSIMPGKVNPVIPEAVNQIAFQVLGNDLTVTLAAQAGQFELNVMMPVMAHNLLQSARILANGCRILRERCVKGIEAHRERCRQQADSCVGIAAALTPYVGYEKATAVAREALRTGKAVWDVAREQEILPEEDLQRIMALQGVGPATSAPVPSN